MAFVFRSQNSPRIPKQRLRGSSSDGEDQNTFDLDTSSSKHKKIPVKGLPSISKIKQARLREQTRTSKDSFEEEIEKKITQFAIHRKNSNIKDKDQHHQYIFKSKSPRVIFSEEKTKESFEEKMKKQLYLKKFEEYEKECKNQKENEKVQHQKFKTLLKEKKTQNLKKVLIRTNGIRSIPSIPGKLNKYGYVIKQNRPPYFPSKVEKQRFSGEDGDVPGPSDYEVKDKSKVKGIVKFGLTKAQKLEKSEIPLINSQDILKDYNRNSKTFQDNLKEKKEAKFPKRYHEMLIREGLQTRAESDDEEEEEYDEYATPGPGYYNCEVGEKKSFRSKNNKYKKIFINQSKRFLEKAYNEGSQSQYVEKKKEKNKFFMSKIPREFLLAKKEDIPPPGYYNTRQTMEHNLIDKMLKNSSTGMFNNNLPRFMQNYENQIPGPGFYDGNMPSFKVQPNRNPVKQEVLSKIQQATKSKNVLKSSENALIIDGKQKKKTNIIHHRDDRQIEELNYAPFMSSSQKFNYIEVDHEKKKINPIRKNILKTKQNFQPFNSSQEKLSYPKDEKVAAVGLYDVTNQHEWITQSHNVLFN